LAVDQWVAVGYEDDKYFVGQVERTNDENVRVNFLCKSATNNFFYWPQVPDKDDVEANVIFYPKVKVVKSGRRYEVQDLDNIISSYEGFSRKYFN